MHEEKTFLLYLKDDGISKSGPLFEVMYKWFSCFYI